MPEPTENVTNTTEPPATRMLLDWWRDRDIAGWVSFTTRSNRDQWLDADQYGELAGVITEEDVLGTLAEKVASGMSSLEAARTTFVPARTRQALWGKP